ncbi:MAG: SDR family oxidoreductase [bacterium]
MATLLTGSTGYLGSYLAAGLLREGEPVAVLVRARDRAEAERRLWRAWQLHLSPEDFFEHLRLRVEVFAGDLTEPDFGLSPDDRLRLARTTDAILHCAASLNRRSERACLNVNIRGTLALAKLAREIQDERGLRRFSHVSTVSVAGERSHEVVDEDSAVDWQRRDYDAYGRTKKFAEHLVGELLPDVSRLVFRPSIVMGDSRFAETTQFDMVRAFSFLASLPVLPLRPLDRIDIVPANWVADAIVTLHLRERTDHRVYHLSAGREAPTYRAITDTLSESLGTGRPAYVPGLEGPFRFAASALGRFGPKPVRLGARLLDVFFPYLTYDTVFDSSRVVTELGRAPASFPKYAAPLLDWSRRQDFRYPHREWPEGADRPPAPSRPATLEDVAAAAKTTNGSNGSHSRSRAAHE